VVPFETLAGMGNSGGCKGNGGNAHDRAVARAANAKQGTDSIPAPAIESQSDTVFTSPTERHEPLNQAESIGLLVGLVGTFFVLIVPTVWQKVPALLLMCFGSAYFIWLSHWTHPSTKRVRCVIIIPVLVLINICVIPQLVEQWRMEHMRSELKFDASATGIGIPEGEYHGIKWRKDFSDIRLVIASDAKFPIQNLNLSIGRIGKDESIAGIAQTDTEPQRCGIGSPSEQIFPPMLIKGLDGSTGYVSPLFNDALNKLDPFRDHYDVSCERITAGGSVALIIATYGKKADTPPSSLHIFGSYDTTEGGGKHLLVDEIVSISKPPRWK